METSCGKQSGAMRKEIEGAEDRRRRVEKVGVEVKRWRKRLGPRMRGETMLE